MRKTGARRKGGANGHASAGRWSGARRRLYAGFMRRARMVHGPFTGIPPRKLGTDPTPRRKPMLDLILLALGAGLFALMATYAAGCERV
jgi:hypothetical protein